ncbi:hypothetical protein Tco_0833284 [Tanacetum coccineum]
MARRLPWMLDDPYVRTRYLPDKEQATALRLTTNADSPKIYIPESYPEKDPADYPSDRGDDGDDKDEPSDDDEDEEVDIEADDEEEEEHPAPADSTTVALPTIDQATSVEEIEPFETDESAATLPPHLAYRVTARISIPALVPTPVWSDADRLGIALGPRYEIGESSFADAARPTGGLRADYGFFATMDREIRRDLERDVGYGITDSWDKIVEAMQGTLVVIDVAEFSQRMTEFETRVRRDTDEAWGRSMDASDLACAEVMSLRTTVLAQQSQIRELQSADRRRQTVIIEMLAADHKRQKQTYKDFMDSLESCSCSLHIGIMLSG